MTTRAPAWTMIVAFATVAMGCSEKRPPEGRKEVSPSAASAPAPITPVAAAPAVEAPTAAPTLPPAPPAALAAPPEPTAKETHSTPAAPPESPKARAPKKVARREHARDHDGAKAAAVDGKVTVKRLLLAHGVRGREPVGRGQTFALEKTERIYAFVEADNPSETESKVTVVFEPPSGKSQHIEIPIGAEKRWRTWAFTRSVHETGTWFASVRDPNGKVLAHTQFKVTP